MQSQRDAIEAAQSATPVAAARQDRAKEGGKRRQNAYVIAVVAVVVLFAIRSQLDPVFKQSSVFLFFAPAVMFCAWYGGRGPGLMATLLGAAAANILLLPPHSHLSDAEDELAKTLVFLIVGGEISWLSGAMYDAKQRAESAAAEIAASRSALQHAHDELEQRVVERTAELQFKTALLEAQSNASLDGILVASDDGRVVFYNQALLHLWNLPSDAFNDSLDHAVAAMRQRLVRGQDPLGGVEADAKEADIEFGATIEVQSAEAQSARTLECYRAPITGADGRSHGRVWYFRDITERLRTGRQILEAGERERQRIGQDLHDDLCQHLTGITCIGRVLHQRLQSRLPDEAPSAGQLVDLVEQAIERAREIARGLQPLQLQTDGLAVALQNLGASISQVFGVACHVSCDPSIATHDSATLIQLYRITQEAISNAIRHGRSRNIYVDLVQTTDRLILSIEDDGVGIDPSNARHGLGMRTMSHRASLIGGNLVIEPAGGGGTVVTCTVNTLPERTSPPETGGTHAAA
jgi:signal transduction histidine kinase